MRAHWFCVVGLALGLPVASQMLAQSNPPDTARLLLQPEAVKLAQAINTTESEVFSRTHKYVSLPELLDVPAFKDRKALPAPLDASGKLLDHYVRVLASPDGRHYLMGITPTAAGCGFAIFSDEADAIYPAGPLDCDEEHQH
ncbi:MAG: hypothetical protein H0X25_06670 [Acidobacteriales bacterium]|nr:hypothetical protein [Terriglobales bacterium]